MAGLQGSNDTRLYIIHTCRKHDYEMYLCTLLMPKAEVRTRVMAIRAFNTEIALIRDQVSQKETGLARLAFWRDSISQLYERKHVRALPPVNIRQPTVLELSRVGT
jgi:phytoene/squalene synthetase